MAVATYSASGDKAAADATLEPAVFGVVPTNHELLKQAYTAYLSNGRTNNAVTKTRGLVSGGGKKPWKQKGTGRARFGSSRNPIWRGGGIVFGPTGLENYTKQLNSKAKRLAIRQALSLAGEAGKVIVIDDITASKTAELAGLLGKVGATKRTVVVVADKTEGLLRASANLQQTQLVQALYLNVYDVLNADTIVITQPALQAVHEWLGGDK